MLHRKRACYDSGNEGRYTTNEDVAWICICIDSEARPEIRLSSEARYCICMHMYDQVRHMHMRQSPTRLNFKYSI
jgi:hypothetical protein